MTKSEAENGPEAGRERNVGRENMNDVELLEKFIQQRDKWKRKNPSSNETDLQIVRRQKRRFWILLMCAALLIHRPSTPLSEYDLWDTCRLIVLSCIAIYSIVMIWRTWKVQALFKRYAIPNAEDIMSVIETLKQ